MKRDESYYTRLSVLLILLLIFTGLFLGFAYDFSTNTISFPWDENMEVLEKNTDKNVIKNKNNNTNSKTDSNKRENKNSNNSKTSNGKFLSKDSYTMKINENYNLEYSKDKNLTFMSEDDTIAIVDAQGKITAKNSGTVKIVAVDKDGNSDTIKITVKDDSEKSFKITKDKVRISKTSTYLIEKKINPETETITWSSSDSNVAAVNTDGLVSAKSTGTAVITGITKSGLKDTIVIEIVDEQVATESLYINLNRNSLTLDQDQTYTLTVDKNVSGTVKWESSNATVATVDQKGKITAKKAGQTTITATINNLKSQCVVNVVKVEYHVRSVSVSQKSVSLTVGGSTKVTATVSPDKVTNKDVTWKSQNTNIATVDSTGKITARAVGSTEIIVTSVDNNKTATVKVTVEPINPTKLVLSASSTKLNVGTSTNIIATVTPSNATDKRVTYSSSNSNVLSVSSTGKVSAKAVGTATITAKTMAGNISSSITFTVVNQKNYTVTFYPNGASGDNIALQCITTSSSCSLTAPSITRSGYNIIGWSTDKNASTASVKPKGNITVSSDAAYYAITNKTVTAKFDKNTITSDISIGYTSKSCTIKNRDTSCTVQLPTISRSGFSNLGWSNSSTATEGTASGINVSITKDTTYYAITKINTDGNIIGATGYSALNSKQYLYKTASTSGTKILTLKWGEPFTILGESGSYWYISYNGNKGYVLSKYCMINLPDYIPSITYDIKDSYSSTLKASGYDIPNVTGKKLYNFGQTYNNRLRRKEFIAPLTYDTAKKVLSAQKTALSNGYSLKVYDSYRPKSVSTKLSKNLTTLYNSNSTVKKNIDYSTGASGTKYYWGQGWFLANTLSTHNVGAAVDISMTKKGSTTDLPMPSAMNELSTKAIKYYSPNVSHTAANYSTGMLNSSAAQKMHTYMTNAGLTDLASEWWHFQSNDSYNIMKGQEPNGCDFTPQGIVSQ